MGELKTALFLIAGQSNAQGRGSHILSTECTEGKVFEYIFTSNELIHLKDPIGCEELSFQCARSGSIAPSFANTYQQLSKERVVIVHAAREGASCHQKAELAEYGTWSDTGRLSLMNNAIHKTQRASQAVESELKGIIWAQGERDANAINENNLTQEEYQFSLEQLIKRFRFSLGNDLNFYIIQTGYYVNHSKYGFDLVREAQQRVAQNTIGCYIVYADTHLFQEKGWLCDDIHYNQLGLNDIGTSIAQKIHSLAQRC